MRTRRAASDAAFGRFGRKSQPGRRLGDAPKICPACRHSRSCAPEVSAATAPVIVRTSYPNGDPTPETAPDHRPEQALGTSAARLPVTVGAFIRQQGSRRSGGRGGRWPERRQGTRDRLSRLQTGGLLRRTSELKTRLLRGGVGVAEPESDSPDRQPTDEGPECAGTREPQAPSTTPHQTCYRATSGQRPGSTRLSSSKSISSLGQCRM